MLHKNSAKQGLEGEGGEGGGCVHFIGSKLVFAPLLVCGVNTVDASTKIGAHHAVETTQQVKAARSHSQRLLGENLLTQLTPNHPPPKKKTTHGSEE